MAEVVAVADVADHRVAPYRGLTDGELRRWRDPAEPDGLGAFIVEGVLAIRALVRSAYPLRSLLVSEARFDALAAEVAHLDVPIYVAPRAVLSGIAGFDVHRGALAAAGRLPPPAVDDLVAAATVLAVVEEVSDHENLGALFRNAAAFGVGAVLLGPRCADPLYRRSVRVSLGHVLHVPWTRLARWPEGLGALRAGGFEVVALTPDRASESLDEVRLGPRVAWMLGAEGPGLSAAALDAADRRVRIPLEAGVDSLNVATAAAIAFHHVRRDHRAGPGDR